MELETLRNEIDGIDQELTRLFCRRMEASAGIAAYKAQHGLPVTDRTRERAVLERVCAQAGAQWEGYTRVLFSTLFDLSRSCQAGRQAQEAPLAQEIRAALQNAPDRFPQKGTVACQGVEGAYSQIACDKLFPSPSILYFRNFEGVFQAVQSGLCEFGVLPIENSACGSVGRVYDLMRGYNFHIVRSVRLHIDHHLLARPGARLADIREVYSHEQAVGQCQKYLATLPDVRVNICENTAEAAMRVAASGRGDVAAISSRSCAALYGLTALAEHVQDRENNYTRFICIRKDLAVYPGADRISLMFTVPHTPGSLYRMIARFAALGLNLTKLESRPLPGSDFDFLFYFDLAASVLCEDVLRLLCELSAGGELFVFLGCYSELS